MRERGQQPDGTPVAGELRIRDGGASAKVRLQGDGTVRPPVLSGARALQIGPGDWLIVAGHADGDTLLSQVREANRNLRPAIGDPPRTGAAGDPPRERAPGSAPGDSSLAFAVDVSQAYATLEIRGERSRDLLEKGCGLDLHPREFAVGAATRTRLASVAVIVERIELETFRCHVARSHRDYLLSWLNDAAGEWPAG